MNTLSTIITNAFSFYINSINNKNIERLSINEFNKKYNLYNLLLTQTLNEPFDFNLMMIMAFLGDALLNGIGFAFSSVILGIILNGFSILLLYIFNFKDYNKENNAYSFFRILYLILCYILLFIGVGGSALLSQKIIVDSNSKYNDYLFKLNQKSEEEKKRKDEEKEKIREKNRIEKEKIRLTEMAGLKKDTVTKIELKEEIKEPDNAQALIKEENDEEDLLINSEKNTQEEGKDKGIINDADINTNKEKESINALDLSLGDKSLEDSYKPSKVTKDKISRRLTLRQKIENDMKIRNQTRKLVKKEQNRFDSFFEICLTTILAYFTKYFINIFLTNEMINNKEEYIKNRKFVNGTDIEEFMRSNNESTINDATFQKILDDLYQKDESLFLIMIATYASALVLSIILYEFFMCNFTKKETTQSKGDKYRVCEILGFIIYSEDKVVKEHAPKCQCLRLLCETLINCFNLAFCNSVINCVTCSDKTESERLDEYNNCCCCCCCVKYEETDYEKNKEFFCYCYQARRKQSWLNKYLTNDIQKKIVPYMVEYC